MIRRAFCAIAAAVSMMGSAGLAAEPLRLHPENPHAILFRGNPAVLITSGEHYGAVLNLDFDFIPYLDALKAAGLNLTRTFSGVYCESPKSFGIKGNPLAPKPGRLISPWARSSTPGYANGGNKFDLTKYDPAYFERLRAFVAEAGKRGIVVEMVLFCPFYEDAMWDLSPMKTSNNINGIGNMARTAVYTLEDEGMLAVHQKVTREIVRALRDADNVYFEICNEPYFGGVTLAWQHRIADTIVDAEKDLPAKHLIAQNIANGSKKIEDPHPAVSIFNFHYARPPVAVARNWGLNKVIADDETGFKGPADVEYRTEGWDFIIAGGAIYSNLDYSFTPDHEDGTAKPDAPGGGGAALRRQLRILKDFIEGLDFVHMKPDDACIQSGVPEKATARALVERGKAYAIYIKGGTKANLAVDLPAGAYEAQWIDTKTGATARAETFDHAGGARTLASPRYAEDIALRILRAKD
ncbi:MAG: hypothetical protein JXP34_06305 [Planctomycetes bacterium]|nr:hypothetical protein [Planctomycetota bacterium]